MPLPYQFPQGWGIFDAGLFSVFDVDTVVDLKHSAKTKVVDFPIEDGSFASYDKAMEPFRSHIRLAVAGQDRVQQFLAALDEVLVGTDDLYSIVTPERVYTPVTLEGYEFSRERERTATMVSVDIEFREVRQVTPQFAQVSLSLVQAKNPSSASKQNQGKQQAQAPETPFKDLTPSQVVQKFFAENPS